MSARIVCRVSDAGVTSSKRGCAKYHLTTVGVWTLGAPGAGGVRRTVHEWKAEGRLARDAETFVSVSLRQCGCPRVGTSIFLSCSRCCFDVEILLRRTGVVSVTWGGICFGRDRNVRSLKMKFSMGTVYKMSTVKMKTLNFF